MSDIILVYEENKEKNQKKFVTFGIKLDKTRYIDYNGITLRL